VVDTDLPSAGRTREVASIQGNTDEGKGANRYFNCTYVEDTSLL